LRPHWQRKTSAGGIAETNDLIYEGIATFFFHHFRRLQLETNDLIYEGIATQRLFQFPIPAPRNKRPDLRRDCDVHGHHAINVSGYLVLKQTT